MQLKRCSKCKEFRSIDDFGKLHNSKDGFQYHCNFCRREYRKNNKQKIKAKDKRYWENNREALVIKKRLYYKKKQRRS